VIRPPFFKEKSWRGPIDDDTPLNAIFTAAASQSNRCIEAIRQQAVPSGSPASPPNDPAKLNTNTGSGAGSPRAIANVFRNHAGVGLQVLISW
jgi:hypothetical protein